MDIEYSTETLLASPELVLVHGCNSKGGFASGIAGLIRSNFPWAYEAYKTKFEESGLTLGEIVWAFDVGGPNRTPENRSRIIGNMITQPNYGRQAGKQYVDYDAVRTGMRNLNRFIAETLEPNYGSLVSRVAMPRIGAGLGGGDWQIISAIIEQESTNFCPVVYTNGE